MCILLLRFLLLVTVVIEYEDSTIIARKYVTLCRSKNTICKNQIQENFEKSALYKEIWTTRNK